jgi:hypothetical protein
MWSDVRPPALKPICSLYINFTKLFKSKSQELLLTLIALAMPFLQMLVFFKVITLAQIYLIFISMG